MIIIIIIVIINSHIFMFSSGPKSCDVISESIRFDIGLKGNYKCRLSWKIAGQLIIIQAKTTFIVDMIDTGIIVVDKGYITTLCHLFGLYSLHNYDLSLIWLIQAT